MAVTVPETITVHLGRPTANAQNVTITDITATANFLILFIAVFMF
jgi:hypothetical protein